MPFSCSIQGLMPHFMVQDGHQNHQKSWGLTGSPHSNLNHGKIPNSSSTEVKNINQDHESSYWSKRAHKSHQWQNRGTAHGRQNHHRPAAESGMRAVFLGGSNSRNGSCGTGVFLPRGTGGNLSDCRKKQGYSTVLIPARVIQALKLQFDQMGYISSSNYTHHNSPLQNQNDAIMVGRENLYWDQKRHLRTVEPPAAGHESSSEISLPQEWTY